MFENAKLDKTIFISHASDVDKYLHDLFLDLLTGGFGIERDKIFSTSDIRNLCTGKDFCDEIKERMKDCSLVILLMTSSFMRRAYCLAELGAAWVLDKRVIPIVVDPVTVEQYNRTPFQGKQFRRLDPNNIAVIYDELCNWGYAKQDTNIFSTHRDAFFDKLRFAEKRGDVYKATLLADRSRMGDGNLVPRNKGCFLLNGLIRTDGLPRDGETHWIFFDRENSPGLRVGDVIEFRISKIDEYHAGPWRDGLSCTRNIYPESKSIRVLN